MWLLRFQMCAVVNRVAVPHLRLRHRHGKSRMRRVVTITDGAKSVGDNITHPLAPSRSPFNSHRNAASPKPVAILHLRLRYRKSGMPRDLTITVEPNLSAATSRIHTSAGAARIAVQLAASKRDIAKALQGQPGEFGATRVFLSNTRASDVTAATAGTSNSASYVLSVSCLFLCGPLRRISVNARFYVQCCLVLWRGGCYGGPLQFPDEIQGQSNWKSSHCWLDSPVVYPDLVLVAVCGRDQCCLSVRFTCLLCVCTVLCSNCGESHRSHKNVRNDEVQVSLRKRTLDMVMEANLER